MISSVYLLLRFFGLWPRHVYPKGWFVEIYIIDNWCISYFQGVHRNSRYPYIYNFVALICCRFFLVIWFYRYLIIRFELSFTFSNSAIKIVHNWGAQIGEVFCCFYRNKLNLKIFIVMFIGLIGKPLLPHHKTHLAGTHLTGDDYLISRLAETKPVIWDAHSGTPFLLSFIKIN